MAFFGHYPILSTGSFTWLLPNFKQASSSISKYFTIRHENDFFLKAHRTTEPYIDHLMVYLCKDYSQKKELHIHFTISIIDSNGNQKYPKEYYWHFLPNAYKLCNFFGVTYIHIDAIDMDLLDSSGALKLHCTVNILKHTPTLKCLKNCQTTKPNFTMSQFQTLLESGKLSDFTITVGDKEFSLHKAILAAQSPVFSAMFDSGFKECVENRMEIPNIGIDAFETLLRYLYTGQVPAMCEYATELLPIAEQYELSHLKDLCEGALMENLVHTSAATLLILADTYRLPKLKKDAIRFINDHRDQVLQTKAWKYLLKTRLELVVELYAHI